MDDNPKKKNMKLLNGNKTNEYGDKNLEDLKSFLFLSFGFSYIDQRFQCSQS